MSLPTHLHPTTYWEKRCELLEESVFRMANILQNYTMPPAGQYAMREHFDEWNRLLAELGEKHPAPQTPESQP